MIKKIWLLLIIIMTSSINNTYAIKFEYEEIKMNENNLYFNFPLFSIPNWHAETSSRNEISKIRSFSVIEKDSLKKIDDIFEKTHNKAVLDVQLIEKNNEVIKFFTSKLWEKNFISALNNNLISILWWSNWCDNSNFIFNEVRYNKCMFENYKDIYLNTRNTEIYKIDLENNENIDLFIYPIDYKNEVMFKNFKFLIEEKVKLSVYDSSLDYYDLKIFGKSYGKNIYPKIEKKYKIVKYYTDNENYIYSIIPYYKVNMDLNKWRNEIEIRYDSYTNDKWNLFYIEKN